MYVSMCVYVSLSLALLRAYWTGDRVQRSKSLLSHRGAGAGAAGAPGSSTGPVTGGGGSNTDAPTVSSPSLSAARGNVLFQAPVWQPDSEAVVCPDCGLKFSLLRRKHHCRRWYVVPPSQVLSD